MFIAALLSAFPEHEAAVLAAIALAAPEVSCGLVRHNDGVLDGRRFRVELRAAAQARTPHDHAHPGHAHDDRRHHDHHHDHEHEHDHHGHDHAGHDHAAAGGERRRWIDIRAHLEHCGLDGDVVRHAIGIFQLLAEAEAQVHGVSVEAVSFHEVGAWDSIADIVGAAQLIAAIGAEGWSVGVVPLGAGRVRTAHGLMAVPAPATTRLLEGFDLIDDGVGGERVTPTGAAILRYLRPQPETRPGPRRLIGSGVGFGTRTLPGLSNCLRVLVFAPAEGHARAEHRELAVVEFEVDDQSAEDLALGLDRLRAHPGIFDVVQTPAFGKKGRMMTAVRLLARPAALDAVIAEVFRQTTTIGLRHHIVQGAALRRSLGDVDVDGRRLRVKIAERPDGPTAKAEADDVLGCHSHARRIALRRAAEDQALSSASSAPVRAPEDVA